MTELRPVAAPHRSRRAVLGLLGTGALTAAGGLGWAAGATAASADHSSDSQRRSPEDLRPGGTYDRKLTEMAERDEFSGTVLLTHRGRTVLSRSYGMADKENSVRNTEDTIFALASASKPFTGLAILQLAQQGRLQLWEKLGTYLTGFPADVADHVTIHQLLTHTSGMGDLNTDTEYLNAVPTWGSADEVVAETLDFIRRAPLHFTPGTSTQYSSNGYDVLGSIVEKVSGQSFFDYVRERVFVPAGMTRTDFYTRPQWLSDKRMAQPYGLNEDGERVNALREPDKLGDFPNAATRFIGTSAGNGFSTAPDLVRFAEALQTNKLLNPAFTELYWSAKSPNPPLSQNPGGGGNRPPSAPTPDGTHTAAVGGSFHAYGAPVALYNNRWLFGHGGGAAGESTNWTIYRDMDWTTVVLANHDGFDLQTLIDLERRLIAGTRS